MTNYARMLLETLADFILAAGGTVSGAMVQAGGVVVPNTGVLILAIVAGCMAAANHIKAAYRQPPA